MTALEMPDLNQQMSMLGKQPLRHLDSLFSEQGESLDGWSSSPPLPPFSVSLS